MKSYLYTMLLVVVSFLAFSAQSACAQNQEPVDLNQLAEEEADKLARLIDLEDWQVFYVDSTLKANFFQLQVELEKLQKAKVTNTDIYQEAKDRCWDEIDRNYQKWFTPEQWKAYLKTGAAKLQKQREKRKEQREN